jgi:hypothetical protein
MKSIDLSYVSAEGLVTFWAFSARSTAASRDALKVVRHVVSDPHSEKENPEATGEPVSLRRSLSM